MGWLQTSNQFIFFCRSWEKTHLGLSENSVPYTQWLMIIIPFLNGYFIGNIPNIFRHTNFLFSCQMTRSVRIRSVFQSPAPIDPAGGSSVGCIQWGVSWWVQGPPNLQICWLWLAIWSQDEANMKPRVAIVALVLESWTKEDSKFPSSKSKVYCMQSAIFCKVSHWIFMQPQACQI